MNMKLVVGLGNPGKRYENSRHNVGYMVIDKLSLALRAKLKVGNSFGVKGEKLKGVIPIKTNVFMNESGGEVKKLMANAKFSTAKRQALLISNLYIVHDDLDIPLGQFKIQLGKGPKVHNGVNSVEEALGSSDFWRVRVGVDNRDPENRIPGEPARNATPARQSPDGSSRMADGQSVAGGEYVLQDFTSEERQILDGVIQNVVKALPHG